MRLEPAAAASPAARLPLIDALRGVAIVAMAIYHLAWDLRYFGFIAVDVTEELGWRTFARAIAGSFLFLVGVSLVLSTRGGFNRARFLKRLGTVAAAAAAITAVTWFAMPEAFIFFGILHCIAVTSVLGLAFVRAPLAPVIAAALLAFFAPRLFAGPAFDHPALLWLGLFTEQPRSNDYVPLFPWFAAVLAGIAAARLAAPGPAGTAGLQAGWTRRLRPLVWAGRHSLAIYLVHQPLLLGLLYGIAQLAPPSLLAFEPGYVESCAATCTEAGAEGGACRATCQCTADAMQAEGLWRALMQSTLTETQLDRYLAVAEQCRTDAAR